MKQKSQSEWIAFIEDTANGRAAWNSHADASPWDGFYRDYRGASAQCRQVIDDAFLDCLGSSDSRVVEEAILHAHYLPAQVAVTRLLLLMADRSTFLLSHPYRESEKSLLACVLNTLASRADSPNAGQHLQCLVKDAILRWVPIVGPLSPSIGTFFGDVGPEATDELVAVLPDAADNVSLLTAAGYELHRSAERWKRVLELASQWQPAYRSALQRGGENHAIQFPELRPVTSADTDQ
jgi:hypothetical protein